MMAAFLAGARTNKKRFIIFNEAMDTQRNAKGQRPEEVQNRPKPQSVEPETANPALGGTLSRRLHPSDGAGRYYLALGHLNFIRSGVRSEDPCNSPGVSRAAAYQQ